MFQKTSLEEPLTCLKLYTDLDGSTTNEVHDLDPVAVLKQGRAPVVAAYHDAVPLDGNSRRGQIKLGD